MKYFCFKADKAGHGFFFLGGTKVVFSLWNSMQQLFVFFGIVPAKAVGFFFFRVGDGIL